MGLKKPHLRYRSQTPRERTWTIHLISIEKILKATVVVVLALRLLSLLDRNVHDWALDFALRHGINAESKYVHDLLERLVGVGNTELIEISTVAFVYATLLYVEGIGLWLQRRWAEYLTVIATGLFIPVELYELFEKFTWVRVAALAINGFILWYLTTRLRDEKHERAPSDAAQGPASDPLIKICGITNREDADLAVECGVDLVGFNFYSQSSRYIEPERAKEIAAGLPPEISKVGVFVNASVEKIAEIARQVGLDVVQLHGDETPEVVLRLRSETSLEIIKALRVAPGFEPATAGTYSADAVLLDSYSAKERGGTGKTFDWTIVKEVQAVAERVFLAGGLTAENISQAIREVRPFAVDVCSSIESSPGKKDPKKVRQFIQAVRATI